MKKTLLLPAPPLQVLPSLAVAIGLNPAIVLQQLHYLLNGDRNGKLIGGEKWIFNTYAEWRGYFPFWSEPTIKRTFCELEERGVIKSCQPEGGISRRKYYRIDVEAVERLAEGMAGEPTESADEGINLISLGTDQGDPIRNGSDRSLPLAETSSKTSTKEPDAPTKSPLEIEAGNFVDWFVALLARTGAPAPRLTPTIRTGWEQTYEKLVRIDGKTKGEIAKVCEWARADPFWATNFYAPTKLRERKDGISRFDLFASKLNSNASSHSTQYRNSRFCEATARAVQDYAGITNK